YFQPSANVNGTISDAITFRAWDATSGTNGGTASTAVNGGTSAFSSTTDTASITVSAVNDAPIASGSVTLAAVSEDTASPAGATVSALFASTFSDAADDQVASGGSSADTLAGIAIVG